MLENPQKCLMDVHMWSSSREKKKKKKNQMSVNPQKHLMDVHMRCRYFCLRSKVKGQRSNVRKSLKQSAKTPNFHLNDAYLENL